jgi:hypothetical protein
MHSTVIGGAMLPQAPQFFTMPETEDKAVVEKVRAVTHKIGTKLRARKPDLWIIFSNYKVEQFFPNIVPLPVHVGAEGSGEFADPQVPLADSGRDRPRTLSVDLRCRIHRHGANRLCESAFCSSKGDLPGTNPMILRSALSRVGMCPIVPMRASSPRDCQ